jgi:putative membrane protein
MMWGGWGGYGWGMGGLGYLLVHLLWWLLLIACAAALLRWLFGHGGRSRHGEDRAIEVLRERYARGEIDQAEYDERLRHLKR